MGVVEQSSLSDQDVLELRRDIRLHGKRDWRVYADRFKSSISAISMAARGVSFKHLNGVETPYHSVSVNHTRKRTRIWKKLRPDEAIISEMMALYKSNPTQWNYATLAVWISDRTQRQYKANHVAALIAHRDPLLKKTVEKGGCSVSEPVVVDKKATVRKVYLEIFNLKETSDTTGVPQSTVARWTKDLRHHKQANSQIEMQQKDQQIIALRQAAAANPQFNITKYATENGLSVVVAMAAVKGDTFKHLNDTYPPVSISAIKADLRLQARQLYQEGKTYPQIKDILKVSKSSLSVWCRDLVPAKNKMRTTTRTKEDSLRVRAAQERERAKRRANEVTEKKQTRCQILTDNDVIHIRTQIRAEQRMNIKFYVEKYKASKTSISMAARGLSFKHIDHIEPPITETFERAKKNGVRQRTDEHLAIEVIALHKAHPEEWTYTKIAAYMSEKTGLKYRSCHVKQFMFNRDPSLQDFVLPKVEKVKRPSEKRQLTAAQKHSKSEADKARRLAEKEAIRKEIQYQDWVEAGQPDDWVWE